MKNVLFINGCIRGKESRTLKIANCFLDNLKNAKIETVNIDAINLAPLSSCTLAERNEASGNWNLPCFDLARQFKAADLVVLAAPFWEGTFPAAVHTYIEHICVTGLTFSLDENGYHGLCKSNNAVFFTTRGGIYEHGHSIKDNHASAFLTTVFGMLGIEKLHTIAAEGLDIIGFDVESALNKACANAAELAIKF